MSNGSVGEQLLAEFFKNECIFYRREHPILVNNESKLSIWYPDFYLPDYGIVVEYFGLVGNENYDKGIDLKKRVYFANSLTLIPVYPSTLQKNWRDYLIIEIRKALQLRLDKYNSRKS